MAQDGSVHKSDGPAGAGSEQVTTLANGIRIVTHHMPHVETVSLGVWVGVGARHETLEQNGISHFLEHMAFKGTATRTARLIAEEIEQVGGELNAATSLETTAYYARVLKSDIGLALEIIADILQNPLYANDEIEREREVILQEIAATRDSPEEIAYDLLNEVAFPDQAVGRAILGTKQSVKRFTTEHLRSFLLTNYRADRMVIAAAGHVDHRAFVAHAEALFGSITRRAPETESVYARARYVGGARASEKTFEQSHVLLGFEGPGFLDTSYFTAQVFSGLFGGGMSSRLFQEARERRGLCYSIYSGAWGLGDTGMMSIYAATGADAMDELIGVVRGELETIAATRPSQREVDRSRAQLKAGLLMSLESSGSRVEQIARQLLVHNRLIPASELVDRVEAVTPEAVRAFVESLLTQRPASAVVVGAGRRSADFAAKAAAQLKLAEAV